MRESNLQEYQADQSKEKFCDKNQSRTLSLSTTDLLLGLCSLRDQVLRPQRTYSRSKASQCFFAPREAFLLELE